MEDGVIKTVGYERTHCGFGLSVTLTEHRAAPEDCKEADAVYVVVCETSGYMQLNSDLLFVIWTFTPVSLSLHFMKDCVTVEGRFVNVAVRTEEN